VGKRAVSGHAQTVNISSRGMLMTTDANLAPGMNLKLAVEWPVRLNDICGLALHAGGKVVRADEGEVAVQFRRYELRTRAVSEEACSRNKLEA
ncbi:MAG: PilZ domain-containing protein, partial [Bryobacteraceae bacterium]